MTLQESESARTRREQHERLLDRLFSEGRVDEAQRLIDQWSQENRRALREALEKSSE